VGQQVAIYDTIPSILHFMC